MDKTTGFKVWCVDALAPLADRVAFSPIDFQRFLPKIRFLDIITITGEA